MSMKRIVLFLIISVSLLAADNKRPDSKLYVANVVGESIHQSEDRIDDVANKEVFTATKTFVETKKKSNTAMAYSNSTGIYFDEETHLDINNFVQEPFRPDRNDVEVEPSLSQTDGFLRYGRIAICTPKLVAGSKMIYSSKDGSVNIKNGKLVMETNDDSTTFYLFDGDAAVKLPTSNAIGEQLKQGQMGVIKKGKLTISDIPDELKKLEELTAQACVARKQVFFEMMERIEGERATKEIKAIQVVPLKLPTEFTISPSTLD